MNYRFADGPMLGDSVPAKDVGDPPRDVFYEGKQKRPDGRVVDCVLVIPQQSGPPPERFKAKPFYRFDPESKTYRWQGPPPKRQVVRGVVIERFGENR